MPEEDDRVLVFFDTLVALSSVRARALGTRDYWNSVNGSGLPGVEWIWISSGKTAQQKSQCCCLLLFLAGRERCCIAEKRKMFSRQPVVTASVRVAASTRSISKEIWFRLPGHVVTEFTPC